MTVSLWQRQASGATTECDVVVIGAGICGIAAALHLQRRGLRVRVVERHQPASGASGRNAGFLMRGCADNYADAVAAFGRERTRDLWRLTERNLQGLLAEGIRALPGTRMVPSVLAALGDRERDRLRESLRLMREDGFDVGWWEGADAPRDAMTRSGRLLCALVNPHDASCHPLEVLRSLARKLESLPLEACEVFAIEEGEGLAVVHASGATLRCGHVLCCTNAYAPLLLPAMAGIVEPKRGQMLAVRAPGLTLHASYYLNFGSEYVRQTASGEIVVGGMRTRHAEREVGYDDETTPWVQDDLERFASDLLGPGLEVVARWAGTMGFTKRHLPIITPAPGFPRGRVWFCGGFTGHGMSMAYEVSKHAIDAMLDDAPNPFALAINPPPPRATATRTPRP
jgi:glycine/D-amino acid oxidase-like deaminating enzyme